MKLATWNVNSIRARLPLVLDWLKQDAPDIALLQEIKCEESAFPLMEIQAAGYQALVRGQKSYNGVAILSRETPVPRRDVLPGMETDPQARYIEAEAGGYVVGSLYFPNGNPKDSEKFPYKLRWMKALRDHAAMLLQQEIPVVLGGDYNVIPGGIDAASPARWKDDALFSAEARAEFHALKNTGWYDALRLMRPHETHLYTFWDYLGGAWDRDDGIRIDHLMLSPEAAGRLQSCAVSRDWRGREKASDHAPVMALFSP